MSGVHSKARLLVSASVLFGLSFLLMGAKKDRPAGNLLRIHILNVGQGDGTVIEKLSRYVAYIASTVISKILTTTRRG